jgi:hypothetical protein
MGTTGSAVGNSSQDLTFSFVRTRFRLWQSAPYWMFVPNLKLWLGVSLSDVPMFLNPSSFPRAAGHYGGVRCHVCLMPHDAPFPQFRILFGPVEEDTEK